jgi:predicted ATPase
MKYKFYTKRIDSVQPRVVKYPAFVIIETKWDDFFYKTNFLLTYYQNQRNKKEIGYIKILQKESTKTNLPLRFNTLPENFCSLGQDNSFYLNLKELFSLEDIHITLESLNDITHCKGLIGEFENENGYKKSLLRNSEAQKALNEADNLIHNIPTNNYFQFSFSTQVSGFIKEHKIDFDFKNNSKIPKRIVSFIGKNGSGKTQVLSRLASSLSGLSEKGSFNTKYLPPFSRVIAVSYSLFDKFEKPSLTKSFSYYYCGIQSSEKLLTEKQIERKIITALKLINQANNLQLLGKYLEELLDEQTVLKFLDEDYANIRKDFKFYSLDGNSTFSSGQVILILVVSEILAHIRTESLILFDEPETHLHPNAVSKLVSIIYKILDRFDSYAIVATHSPQIIQEIPSSSIFLFSSNENSPKVRKLGIETFGENLTTLTQKIFQTADVDEYYKKLLKDLSEKYSASEILKLFEKDGRVLSLNAKIYLESLFTK